MSASTSAFFDEVAARRELAELAFRERTGLEVIALPLYGREARAAIDDSRLPRAVARYRKAAR